jgi:hypothetical protein
MPINSYKTFPFPRVLYKTMCFCLFAYSDVSIAAEVNNAVFWSCQDFVSKLQGHT